MGFMIEFRSPSPLLSSGEYSFFFQENTELVHFGIGWIHGEDGCGFSLAKSTRKRKEMQSGWVNSQWKK